MVLNVMLLVCNDDSDLLCCGITDAHYGFIIVLGCGCLMIVQLRKL